MNNCYNLEQKQLLLHNHPNNRFNRTFPEYYTNNAISKNNLQYFQQHFLTFKTVDEFFNHKIKKSPNHKMEVFYLYRVLRSDIFTAG